MSPQRFVSRCFLLLHYYHFAATATASARQAVIFDIDGTITCTDYETGFVRRKARAAVESYLNLRYQVVLLTARPQSLQWYTRQFLSLWGFPLNNLTAMVFAPQRLQNDQEKRTYKRTTIQNMTEELGLEFRYAYGDSTSDFWAYQDAGIDSKRVFATRRFDEENCLPGNWSECLDDYVDHLQYIERQPLASDP
jgi:hydroxymethylpyrimidine pyrophosphatase-like HAD family hydrolase